MDLSYILDTSAEMLVETFVTTTDYRPAVGRSADPWSYFGVPVGASDAAIKKSYRKVARSFHPDRLIGIPSAQQANLTNEFKRAALNYKILTDRRSGKILRAYGVEGWRVYKPGDNLAKVREKLMKHYSQKYQARDPFGPQSDPIKSNMFVSPFKEAVESVEEKFTFDPNSTTNEGRWRLRDPNTVHRYFRRESSTPGVSYVMGKDKSTGEDVIQAVRFDKVIFTEPEAARWWLKNKKKDEFTRLWTWKGKR